MSNMSSSPSPSPVTPIPPVQPSNTTLSPKTLSSTKSLPAPPPPTVPPPSPSINPPPPQPSESSPPPPESSSPPPPDSSSPPPPYSSPSPPPDSSSPPPPNKKPPQSPPPPSPTPPPATPNPPENPSQPPPETSPPPPSNTSPSLSISLPASPSSVTPQKSSPPPPPPTPSVLSPLSSSAHSSPHISSPGIPSTNAIHAMQDSPPGNGTGGTVTAVLVVGFMLLGILGTVACCVWKRKRKASVYNCGYVMPPSHGSSPESDSELLKKAKLVPIKVNGSGKDFVYSPCTPGAFGNPKTWFAYKELVEATGEFSAQNLLGEGGFGAVYKGILVDGCEVAVKQLKIGGTHGEREFKSEVEIISRIHHRHLVSLVGYCIHENRRLLVYEYVQNNNLFFHLHGEGRPVLDWATRLKIATGAARGLAYLHEDCHPRIIHRDIKSSNILLDKNFEARVSDFGLAKLAVDANSHVTTRVMGSFGYMAPEYASSGKLTEKSDVYSYGVVLLELITGRKPIDSSKSLGEESLVEWARPMLSRAIATHEFSGLTDPSLEFNFVDSEMFQMIEAAAACLRHTSARRPKMGQVARALGIMDMGDLSNGMKVGESGMFNAGNESEEIRLFRRMAFGSQDYSTSFFLQDYCSSEGNHLVHSRSQVMQ